jgi:hypothetical protein
VRNSRGGPSILVALPPVEIFVPRMNG